VLRPAAAHWMAEGVSLCPIPAKPASSRLALSLLGVTCWLNRQTQPGVAIAKIGAVFPTGASSHGLENVRLGDGVEVLYSVLRDAVVGRWLCDRPYAQLRPWRELGARLPGGPTREIKQSHLAAGFAR